MTNAVPVTRNIAKKTKGLILLAYFIRKRDYTLVSKQTSKLLRMKSSTNTYVKHGRVVKSS
jgi:lipid-A-disaccharide synthase-like uncharacterized protein